MKPTKIISCLLAGTITACAAIAGSSPVIYGDLGYCEQEHADNVDIQEETQSEQITGSSITADMSYNLGVIELPIIPITTKTTVTTSVTTTHTTVITTVVTPTSNTTDISELKYGDVNLDGTIGVSDVVSLNKYILNQTIYPLKSETAKENADCKRDGIIDMGDSSVIINYLLDLISEDDLGKE